MGSHQTNPRCVPHSAKLYSRPHVPLYICSDIFAAYQLEYQKRFKEEADKAPVIDTPNGPVKIVRVGNNPPVTVPVVLVTKKAPVADDVKFRHIFGMR